MIPVYGFLAGDSLGLLIFAYADDTVETLAARLRCAAAVRVLPSPKLNVVRYHGVHLNPLSTLRDVGMGPLDRFEVIEETKDAS